MLYLFDLNGFKRYNDTFGHPAGDELLIRLGSALQAAVGEDGTAYRIGGDEFCLLLTCAEDRFDAVAPRRDRSADRKRSGASRSAPPGARRRSRPRPATRRPRCSSPTCACTRRRSRGAQPPPGPIWAARADPPTHRAGDQG